MGCLLDVKIKKSTHGYRLDKRLKISNTVWEVVIGDIKFTHVVHFSIDIWPCCWHAWSRCTVYWRDLFVRYGVEVRDLGSILCLPIPIVSGDLGISMTK